MTFRSGWQSRRGGHKINPVCLAFCIVFYIWFSIAGVMCTNPKPQRRTLFRCVGTTALQQNVIKPTAATLLQPFHIPPGDMHTPLSTSNLVFTADLQQVDGTFRLLLLSMSAEEAASFTFTTVDTLADVLYTIASKREFRSFQVKIFLSNGVALDSLDARMSVPKLLEIAQEADLFDE